MTTATAQTQTKSVGLAYVLWLFLGLLGAHRFYLAHTTSGVIMAVLTIVSIVIPPLFLGMLAWWLIDAALIPRIRNTRAGKVQLGPYHLG